MLNNFFRLNAVYIEFERVSDLAEHFSDSTVSSLSNVKFLPRLLDESSGNIFKRKKFKNVSFAFTIFQKITFTDTVFEDCLFLFAEFSHCHFFNCRFVNCNMHKLRLEGCYLDPHSFEMDKSYKKTAANVGTWLFQQLFMNSKNTHQPDFSGESEILFRRWLSAQKVHEFRTKKTDFLNCLLDGIKFGFWWLKNTIFDLTMGYGHKPLRFVLVSIVGILVVSAVVHSFWSQLGLGYNGDTIEKGSYLTSVYYTTVVTTTLGFGDVVPTQNLGRIVAIILSVSGVIWFSLLAAVLIKRIVR